MMPSDQQDQIKYLEADIKRLLNETSMVEDLQHKIKYLEADHQRLLIEISKLETKNIGLKTKVKWQEMYTKQDGGRYESRAISVIIQERDEAQADTATTVN